MSKQFDKEKAYLCQTLLGHGHAKFGVVAERKQPDDEDGGEGGSDLRMDQLRAHPLLSKTQMFDGIDNSNENPVAEDNAQARNEYELRYQAKLTKQLGISSVPTASPVA